MTKWRIQRNTLYSPFRHVLLNEHNISYAGNQTATDLRTNQHTQVSKLCLKKVFLIVTLKAICLTSW